MVCDNASDVSSAAVLNTISGLVLPLAASAVGIGMFVFRLSGQSAAWRVELIYRARILPLSSCEPFRNKYSDICCNCKEGAACHLPTYTAAFVALL